MLLNDPLGPECWLAFFLVCHVFHWIDLVKQTSSPVLIPPILLHLPHLSHSVPFYVNIFLYALYTIPYDLFLGNHYQSTSASAYLLSPTSILSSHFHISVLLTPIYLPLLTCF